MRFCQFWWAGAHGKTSTTGILSHVLSNITDMSYLIGDRTGRGSAGAKYFVLSLMSMSATSCLIIQNTLLLRILTLIILDYFTSLEDDL